MGSNYLVMEFVDGETLQDRIARGPVPVNEAIPIARQIVEALEAAHQAGIIHRDLKPVNVKLTRDGDVKVLDFGLAKLSESALAASNSPVSPTVTLNATREGMILGTPAYMAPEQARGGVLDKRADIWAFGCVLYEVLTGRRAFQGESTTDTIAAVLRAEPDWTALPAHTPEPIRRLLKRCLEKDCRRRLTDIGVARLEIEDALLAPETPPVPPGRSRGTHVWVLGGVALALTMAAAGGGAWWGTSHVPRTSSWAATLMGSGLYAASARASPDGQLIAFLSFVNGLPQLGVMTIDGGSWNILTSDRANGTVSSAAWARDGSRIYFDRSWGLPRGVYSIPPLGGEPRLVLDDAFGPDTLPDGTLTVVKYTDQGDMQLFHFWPDSGRLDPLPILQHFPSQSFRSLADCDDPVEFHEPPRK